MMTNPANEPELEFIEVRPNVPDAPIVAVELTNDNAAALAAHLSAMVRIFHSSDKMLTFDMNRCVGLNNEAYPHSWIVRHVGIRDIEIFPSEDSFRRAYAQVEPAPDADPIGEYLDEQFGDWAGYAIGVELEGGAVRTGASDGISSAHAGGILRQAAHNITRKSERGVL